MKKKFLMAWVVLTLLLSMAQLSEAGVVVEQQMKDREGKATQVVLSCSENQIRTDHSESGLTTILNFRDDQIVLIDHRSKSYLSMNLSQWEKEVAEQLKKENPAVQPKERRIMVRRFGETAILNGFKTEKVRVFANGELMEEHWVTRDVEWIELERVMERTTQEFSKEFRSEMREGREIQKKLKSYGFSILVKDYTITPGLGAVDVLEVKKIERKELKEDIFLPPSGYKRILPQPFKK